MSVEEHKQNVSGVADNEQNVELPTIIKYYDIDTIWNEKASPDDELIKYVLTRDVNFNERKLTVLAHMIVDPLLDITIEQIKYMLSNGYTEKTRNIVLRKNVEKKDLKLLRDTQFINPDGLK